LRDDDGGGTVNCSEALMESSLILAKKNSP
jgi:hypothetical protein